MHIVSALGPLAVIRDAAEALDAADPRLASAISWFEEGHGRFRLEAYADDAEAAALVIGALKAAAPGLSPRAEPLQDADWVAMALDGLPAVKAGRFVVGGAHALRAVRGGRVSLWIEASEAFGTGHHGTTHGCLLALERLLRDGRAPRRVLDVGAGSGVLALAAAKAARAAADAVEIDSRAAAILQENIINNRLTGLVRGRCADGARAAAGPTRYDLIFANILMRPLIGLAPVLTRALAPGGRIILSGLIARQAQLARRAYEARGLVFERRWRREGWATLVLRRPDRRARKPG